MTTCKAGGFLRLIKKRFDAEGVEIPFPYQTVVFKNQPEKRSAEEVEEDKGKRSSAKNQP